MFLTKNRILAVHKNYEIPVFINPFVPNAPFLYTLKTSENRKVLMFLRGRESVHWEQMGYSIQNSFKSKAQKQEIRLGTGFCEILWYFILFDIF